MPFKATIFFECNKFGWTESYFTSETTHAKALAKLRGLARLRLALCGRPVFIPYLRVSDEVVRGDSQVDARPLVLDNPLAAGGNWAANDMDPEVISPAQAADNTADRPYSGILIRMDAPVIGRKMLFMRGVPDSMITTGDAPVPAAGWQTAFTKWKKELQTNWTYYGVNKDIAFSPQLTVGNVTYNAPAAGLFTVTINNHGLATNDKVLISGVKNKQRLAAPNGTRTITVVNANSFTLQDTTVAGDWDWTGGGTVQKVRYSYLPIDGVTVIRCAKRNTGRPFASPVGRRRRKR